MFLGVWLLQYSKYIHTSCLFMKRVSHVDVFIDVNKLTAFVAWGLGKQELAVFAVRLRIIFNRYTLSPSLINKYQYGG
jgi:hypothetical protein